MTGDVVMAPLYRHVRRDTHCSRYLRRGQDTRFWVVEYEVWLPFPPAKPPAPGVEKGQG